MNILYTCVFYTWYVICVCNCAWIYAYITYIHIYVNVHEYFLYWCILYLVCNMCLQLCMNIYAYMDICAYMWMCMNWNWVGSMSRCGSCWAGTGHELVDKHKEEQHTNVWTVMWEYFVCDTSVAMVPPWVIMPWFWEVDWPKWNPQTSSFINDLFHILSTDQLD